MVSFNILDDLIIWCIMVVVIDGNLYFGNGEVIFIMI